MRLTILIITVLSAQGLCSQDSTRIKIEAGQSIGEIITPAKKYKFPSFMQGNVFLKDKQSYTSRLNYNYLSGEVEFISSRGDTLTIANEIALNIDRVIIDTTTFFYDKGYLELVRWSSIGSIAKRQMFVIESKEKMGAYNLASPTSAIESYNSFMDKQGHIYDLTAREGMVMKMRTDYFFGNEFHLFLPANKRTLDKLFVKKKQQAEIYLKDQNVNFGNENDLIKLFVFLSGSFN